MLKTLAIDQIRTSSAQKYITNKMGIFSKILNSYMYVNSSSHIYRDC